MKAIEAGSDLEAVLAEPQHLRTLRPRVDDGVEKVHGGRADESGDEAVARRVVKFAGRPDLLEQPAVENGHARPHRHGLDLVVGDVEGRDPGAALQRRDLLAHLASQARVEVGKRFVHEERFGRAHQRPRHRNPLPLPARELRRLAAEVVGEFERRRYLADLALDVGDCGSANLEAKPDVLGNRQVGVKRVGLEHHRDVAVAGCGRVGKRAVDQQAPGSRVVEPGDDPQGS